MSSEPDQSGRDGPYIHPAAICESDNIGRATRIWAFAHVLRGARIGEDCNICDHVFIEDDVVLGDRTTVKSGVQLWNGVRTGIDVFIGPNATFTNDPFPRSKQFLTTPVPTVIEDGASIGANATVVPGVRIGRHAMVGAGSVVTSNVPPNAVVMGNPARITGYTDPTTGRRLNATRGLTPSDGSTVDIGVPGVTLIRLPRYEDIRGSLTVGEVPSDVPFTPARYFLVFDVPSRDVRGEHAHRVCTQFLTCVHGSCTVMVDDGRDRGQVVLDSPDLGLLVPPMVWASQFMFTEDAVLLVLASHAYDPDDYIRDYDEFLATVNGSCLAV